MTGVQTQEKVPGESPDRGQSAHRQGRRRGRPQAPLLTRERITDTALELMARTGHQAFTLGALAKELRVSPSALYNHAASKATVILWMQEDLSATIDVECFATLTCREALIEWARSYRAAYAPYPMLVPVMALQPIADAPATMAMYETVVGALLDDGWDEADAVNAIVAIESFVFGSALDTAAPHDIFDADVTGAPRFGQAVRAREAVGQSGREAADAAFELGLRALITGLYS